jgi:hypothetical protein
VTQLDFGPVNITYGNNAEFVTQFFDSNGNMFSPVSALLSITYLNVNNIAQTDAVTLLPSGGNLVGIWSSINAAPGLASWTVTATGASTVAQVGVIRVIQEFGAFNAPLMALPVSRQQIIITVGGTYAAVITGDIIIDTTAAVTLNLPDSLITSDSVSISDISGNPNVLILPFVGQTVLGLPGIPLAAANAGLVLWPQRAPLSGGWYIK